MTERREGDGRVDWPALLAGQLDFYWSAHLWPRLDGLTDKEFFWEPVEGCWTLRPGPDGSMTIDWAWPEPTPPPVTTIGWRLAHVIGCIATRTSTFFGDGSVPPDADMFDERHRPPLPSGAAEALAQLEGTYVEWRGNVAGLGDDGLAHPLGPRGGPYADDPMAELVAHVNREVMHHGAEICLLRDLYRAGLSGEPRGGRLA
jgi:hypothetical protein